MLVLLFFFFFVTESTYAPHFANVYDPSVFMHWHGRRVGARESRFIFTACKFEWRAQMSLLVAAQNIKSFRAASAHYYIAHQACSSTFLCTWLYCLLVSHGVHI
jgi:hypothetical protein